MPDMFYPTEEMIATARTIRAILNHAWSEHSQTLNGSILVSASGLLPQMSDPMQTKLHYWNQSMQDCYGALYELVDTLECGAQGMSTYELKLKNSLPSS